MKRLRLIAALLAMGAMSAAQMMSSHAQANAAEPNAGAAGTQSPHGVTPSSRTTFGKECAIADTSYQSATGLSRSPEGAWSVVSKDRRPGPNDNAVARVWHESNWMVDLHDAPGDGTTIHTGQMCFDENGNMSHMIDRYMNTPKCDCMRFTSLSFDATGKTVKQEQKFVKIDTGAVIAAPAAAKEFPEVFAFRKLEQLPFYLLMKK